MSPQKPSDDPKRTTRPRMNAVRPEEKGKKAASRHLSSTLPPPSSTTSLEEHLVLPEQRFFEQLDERARRAEMLNALLQAKGITTDRAVRALQAALGAIVQNAEEAHIPQLSSLCSAIQAAIGELGLTPAQRFSTRCLDVLVLDETEVSRDLVALAVEAHGHMVRSAGNYQDFVRHIDERLPDLIVTDAELAKAPAPQFCRTLKELLTDRPVPIVLFSSLPRERLAELSRVTGAVAAIPKDSGLAALMAELDRILPPI